MSTWSVSHPLYEPFDSLLEAPATASIRTLEPWCNAAGQQAAEWPSQMLYAAGRAIVEYYPYSILDSQLAAFDGSPEAQDDLGHSRRLLMIGRDCLSLAIPHMQKQSRYQDLRNVTHELGNIVEGEPVNSYALQSGIWHLSNMEFRDADVTDRRSARRAVNHAIKRTVPVLSQRKIKRTYAPIERYHESRRQFRRVVHGAMAAAVYDPTVERQQFAIQGVALNKATGAKKNKLYKALSRHLVEKSV